MKTKKNIILDLQEQQKETKELEKKLKTIIQSAGDYAVISSRDVALYFGKEHKHVLKAIEDFIEEYNASEFDNYIAEEETTEERLFFESEYTTETANGRYFKEYLLTKNGFSFIVMNFQGKRAKRFKVKIMLQLIEAQKQIEMLLEDKNSLLSIAKSEAKQEERKAAAERIEYSLYNVRRMLNKASYKELEDIINKTLDIHTNMKTKHRYKYHRYMTETEYKQAVVKYITKHLDRLMLESLEPLTRTVASDLNVKLHKKYIETTNRSNSQKISHKNKKILELSRHTYPSAEEFNTINRHGFTCNQMYTYNFRKTFHYLKWINNFDFDSVYERKHWESKGVDFSKPVELFVHYTAKKEIDVNNLDKAFIDMLFNRIYAIDDSIVTSVISKRIDTCTTYDTGKISYYIRNHE